MASPEQIAKTGLQVAGNLNSANASAIVRIPLTRMDTNAAVTLTINQYLAIDLASIVPVVAGDSAVFYDVDDPAVAEAIVAIADGGAGEDTVNVAGDRSIEFEAGRSFVIANSTANDGTFVSTGAVYDVVADETTISVVTASWTDTTVDGDITTTIALRDASVVVRGTYSASSGQADSHDDPNLRRGRLGEGVYAIAVAGVVDAKITGLVRKVIPKSGPTGNPA